MANKRLDYEDVRIAIIMMQMKDVITASVVTENAEDTEDDFFAPLFNRN